MKNRKKSFAGQFSEFFNSEKIGGLILLLCTIVSLVLSNTDLVHGYTEFWHKKIGWLDIQHWINDGLMAIFFLLIGLELEREIYTGELSSAKNALFPVSAAIGGMLFPALIYSAINIGSNAQNGFGIPMATDIAFAVGVLSLLGNKVNLSLKVFLTALAIADDLGAILIIALFYSKNIIIVNLTVSLAVFILLLFLNRLKVNKLLPYVLGGITMWYFMHESGVHASIAGVMLAFAIPFNKGKTGSCSSKLEHALAKPVAFFILPLFAMANTAIIIHFNPLALLSESYVIGIILGLVIGKPAGILLFSYLSVRLRLSEKPESLNWGMITGAGLLAGIGFTMSIFITLLAFNHPEMIDQSKIAIMFASVISGLTGFFVLKRYLGSKKRMNQ